MPRRDIVRTVEVPSSRLARRVTRAFLADFKRHGIGAIEQVRQDNPAEYLKLVVKLVPKQLDVGVQHSFSDVLLAAAEQIQAERVIDGEAEQISDCFQKEKGGVALVGEGSQEPHARANDNILPTDI